MELAVIIATLVVVILQIITIAQVSKIKKNVSDQAAKIDQAMSHDRSNERRDRDFRSQNRRPGNDQRQKPSAQAQQTVATGSVETVEKSLRDINLKLKNAERDQEFARRKVQENFNKDSNRRHDRSDRSERSDRNDRNNRGGNRDNRHGGNRDRRSGNSNWQERNRSREPLNFSDTPVEADADQNRDKLNMNPAAEQIQSQAAETVKIQMDVQTPETSSPEAAPSDFGSDDMQHGRKILVKRRALKENENSQSEGSDDESSSSGNVANESSTSSDNQTSEENSADGEIRFGRR